MGLRTDEAWVAQVPNLPTTLPEATAFAYPLTDDEVVELGARGSGMTEEMAAFGTRYPETYGGLRIDNAAGGRLTMAFTDGMEERQEEVDAEFGAGRVHVVEVAHSEAELRGLGDEVVEFLQSEGIAFAGVGSGSAVNAVSVHLSILDDASVRPIVERFGTERLCVEGADPADAIPDGRQPEQGQGWRLLADEPGAGAPYRTDIAIDQVSFAALWTEIGLSGEPPPVDFLTEVAIWFGPAVSGSCNDIRLDDVVVDAAAGLVYPTIVLPGGERSCTSDANPHAYVVALERDGLPAEFTVQLGPEVICTGCEEAGESETTPVTLDP